MNTYFSIEIMSGVAPVTGLTSAEIKFRISPYGETNLVAETITVTEIGYGVYVCYGFTVYQNVKLFLSGVEQTWFGIQKAGIDSNGIVMLTGNQTVAGVKTFSSSPIVPAATLTGQAMRFDETVRLTSNQTVGGNKDFTGQSDFGNGTTTNVPKIVPDTEFGLYPELNDNGHIVYKKWLDDSIANISVTSFQESVRKVRVFPEGTQVTGQVYKTIKNGVDYFATPTDSNLCCVEIAGMAGATYISAASGSLKDYVTIKGTGHHIKMYLLDITATKSATLENMTVLMGEGGGNGARTYNGVTFENCIIHYYNDVKLTNCVVRNCLFLGSSTYAVTLEGSTKVVNSQFNNAVVQSGTFTGAIIGMIDGFTYNPPSDPTSGE